MTKNKGLKYRKGAARVTPNLATLGRWSSKCTVKVDCEECKDVGECDGKNTAPHDHSYYCDICGFVTIQPAIEL